MRAFWNAARRLGFGNAEAPKTRQRPAGRRLGVEPLEERRVLSASALLVPLYQDILHRAPDPDGEAYFTSIMAAGVLPASVVAEIWNSPEHRGMEVDAFYQTFFNRPADADGRTSWINALVAGAPEEIVTATFLDSSEFQQLNPTPTQFVTALYHDVLGRDPDPSGLSTFVGQLNSQTVTPSALAWQFILSTERHTNTVNADYLAYLGRPADSAGLAGWVQQLDNGVITEETLAEDLLSSHEFQANNFLIPHPAQPGQISVTIVGLGYVSDSTGMLNTLVGANVATYNSTNDQNVTLQASSLNIIWSQFPGYPGVGTLAVTPEEIEQGFNVTATFY